tara:strand:- start:1016 stop:1663 length:648 start_codon:yes stop_codon:yes gene_type:complete
MKIKLITTALLGFIINVASAGNGSAGLGYASDYFREGSLVSGEALQASASYELKAGGLDAGLGIFTNQPTEGGVDTYIIDASISKALNDTFSASLGLEHTEFVSGVASLDVVASLSLNTILSPSLTVKRDTEDDLYVVEVGASHDLDFEIVQLTVGALYGNADVSSASNVDYYSVGASLSRSLSENSSLEASLDYVDSDLISNESIFGVGINIKF